MHIIIVLIYISDTENCIFVQSIASVGPRKMGVSNHWTGFFTGMWDGTINLKKTRTEILT